MSTREQTDVVSAAGDVLILDTVRSPLGRVGPGGALAGVRSAQLLEQVTLALLDRSRLNPAEVTRTLIAGSAGFDSVARETCRLVGVPPALPVPLGSGSSPQSIIHAAARAVARDELVLVLAAATPEPGVASSASRLGITAELVASRWKLGRADVDAYARRSRRRAREVAAMGEFGSEIIPIVSWTRDSCTVIAADETIADGPPPGPRDSLFFEPVVARRHPEIGWHLHAGNVSHPAVGAAAALLVGEDRAIELGLRPRARILAMADTAYTPGSPKCGPIRAARAVLEHTGIHPDRLDHYEISEAFPSIPLAWQREFDADTNRLNPRGGAIALGRPGPAAGLRSLATTLAALEATGGRLGIQVSDGIGSTGAALLLELLPRTAPVPGTRAGGSGT